MSRSRKKNWRYSIALSCCSKKKDKAIFHRIYRAHVRDCINLGQFELIGGKMLKHQRRWTWQCEAILFSTKQDYSIETICQKLRTEATCHSRHCDGECCWVCRFCRICGSTLRLMPTEYILKSYLYPTAQNVVDNLVQHGADISKSTDLDR